jgi:sec-independent protein translocase protein TatA
MFNLGPWEIILILLVVLLLFGAKRLPELAKGLGQGIKEFKGAMNDAKQEIEDAGEPDGTKAPSKEKHGN